MGTEYERSNPILAGMGVGWTPALLKICYPGASKHLIANFVKTIRKLPDAFLLALYVSSGHESFVKGPAVLFTQEQTDLRLDGLLTLIVMTCGRLGDLFVLFKYPEQFNKQLDRAAYRKMKDWRSLLLQYLLQQSRSLTGEDRFVSDDKERYRCGGMPL